MEENGNVKRSSRVRKFLYQPPSSADIRTYVHAVSKALGAALDEAFDTPEFRNDFAAFMQVVAAICAKQQNKQPDALDSDRSSE
jgi:hypothetical protein